MPHVLIIDDLAICRDPIELALKSRGFQTSTAGSGREAFFEMYQRRPDAVLLDVTMPEMDGLSVLRAIRRNPQFCDVPVVLLTERCDSATVLEAVRHSISGYILKSGFTVDGLVAALAKCIPDARARPARPSRRDRVASSAPDAPAEPVASSPRAARAIPTPQRRAGGYLTPGHDGLDDLHPIITRKELRDIVSHGLELRPLSATVQQVIALTGNANCSVDDVSHVVAQDQALSVRLLKTANSTAFARGKPVDTVKVAIQRLGIHEVRHLAATLAVLDEFTGAVSEHLDAQLFWEHSISCGVIARELAERVGFGKPDDCFLWGVLHDVGRLILIDHVPDLYARIWETADERSLPLVSVERHMLTLDHGDILARALEHWRFSNDFIVPVVNHHRTVVQLRRLGDAHMQGAAIVSAANVIAHALMLGDSGDRTVYDASDVFEILDLRELVIDDFRATVETRIKDIKHALLARSDAGRWPDYAQEVRDSLRWPARPLFVAGSAGDQVFRAFFQRLSGPDTEDRPNVAVMVCGRDSPFETQLRRLIKLEAEAEVPLPILVIALDKSAETAAAPGRTIAVCQAPLNIGLFVRALNDVLSRAPVACAD